MALAVAIAALFAQPSTAHAFDCAKAKTDTEKAICADPKLKAADEAMATAYSAARKRLRGDQLKMLATSQRKWLTERDEQGSYILEFTEARRRYLSGEPDSGPGVGRRLVPFLIQQDGDTFSYNVDFRLLRFADARSPGEKLFNSQMEKISEEANLGRGEEAAPKGTKNVDLAYVTLAFASPGFLSAQISSFEAFGYGTGIRTHNSLNIDLANAIVLDVSRFFDSSGFAALKANCIKQVIEAKGSDFKPEEDGFYSEDNVESGLRNGESWTFSTDQAEVWFDRGSLGSYSEPEYVCTFSTDELRKLARPKSLPF